MISKAQEAKNYIGGTWVKGEGSQQYLVSNPADASVVGSYQVSTVEDAKKAVSMARAAFAKWRKTPAPTRGKVLQKAADIIDSRVDEIARALTMEEGKTLAESTGEVKRAADIFRFYAGQGMRINGKTYQSSVENTFLFSTREPLGVVAVMTPWNFPLAIPSWKIAPALISGNSVVFKPASLTPFTATKLVQALADAGVPQGVLNLVIGPGSTVGEELATNSEVDAISFTGSYDVGNGIQRARANSKKMARVQLEMGGKNPTIVLQDAKLDEAALLVSRSGFGLTGQACTATSRVIVVEAVKEQFTRKLVDLAQKTRLGNGLNPDVQMGPAVSKGELDKDLGYVELGKHEGAKVLAGGDRDIGDGLASGNFIRPTVFDDVGSDMRIAREEIFGPVISVMSAKNLDDAITIANDTEFGLTAGICTSDLSSALRFADSVQAGVVKVNRPTTGLEYQVPFGGVKKSSSDTFREQGEEAIDFYTRIKTVYVGY